MQETRWLVPGHITISTYTGTAFLDDMIQAAQEMEELVEQHPAARVHLIGDFRNMDELDPRIMQPRHLMEIGHFFRLRRVMGYLVVVDPRPLPTMERVGNAVLRTLGFDYVLVSTMEEALAFLAEHDPAIPMPGEEAETTTIFL